MQESVSQETAKPLEEASGTVHSSSPADAQSGQHVSDSNAGSSGATPGSCSSMGPSLQLLQALGPEHELELSRIAETHPVRQPSETQSS